MSFNQELGAFRLRNIAIHRLTPHLIYLRVEQAINLIDAFGVDLLSPHWNSALLSFAS